MPTKEELRQQNALRRAREDFKADLAAQHGWATTMQAELKIAATNVDSAVKQFAACRAVFVEGAKKWDFLADPAGDLGLDQAEAMEADLKQMGVFVRTASTALGYFADLEKKADTLTSAQIEGARALFRPYLDEARNEYKECQQKSQEIYDLAQTLLTEFTQAITKTVARAVELNHGGFLQGVDLIYSVASTTFATYETFTPEPLSEKAVAGIKLLMKGVSELVKEARLQYVQRTAQLGDVIERLEPLDIAKGRVKDTMRLVGLFIESFDLVIPKWAFIAKALEGGIEAILSAPVKKAEEELEKAKEAAKKSGSKASAGETALKILKEAGDEIEEKFNELATKSIEGVLKGVSDIVEGGKDLAATAISTVLDAFGSQFLKKFVDPAQVITKEEIQSYVGGMKSTFEKFELDEEFTQEATQHAFLFDAPRVQAANKAHLKAMKDNQEDGFYVAVSEAANRQFGSPLIMLIGGSNTHSQEDMDQVLTTIGAQQGTISVKKGKGFIDAGTLTITGIQDQHDMHSLIRAAIKRFSDKDVIIKG